MISLRDNAPDYLFSKNHLISTVLFTVLFSLVFLLVSIPFSNNVWFQLGAGQLYIFTLTFFAIATFILIVSRRIMYLRRKDSLKLTFLSYIIWCIIEIIIISLLYGFFTVEGEKLDILNLAGNGFAGCFLKAMQYCGVSIGIPYILTGMYFAIQDRDNTIKIMNMDSVVGDLKSDISNEKRITLFDNNSVLKFSVDQENLYYIESDDNYIKVWYSDSTGEIRQYMLRCKLKTVEESFRESDLLRCHRKYIVNISKIKILMRGKDSYLIDLGLEGVDTIPVSKTYEETVLSRFNSR